MEPGEHDEIDQRLGRPFGGELGTLAECGPVYVRSSIPEVDELPKAFALNLGSRRPPPLVTAIARKWRATLAVYAAAQPGRSLDSPTRSDTLGA